MLYDTPHRFQDYPPILQLFFIWAAFEGVDVEHGQDLAYDDIIKANEMSPLFERDC